MASPISLKGLDDLVKAGASIQFIAIGAPGGRPDYWIVVALPFEGDKAYVLVSTNNPAIRTLRHADAIVSLVQRYPEYPHIQASLLPLVASLTNPEDIYVLSKSEIMNWDAPRLGSREGQINEDQPSPGGQV